MKTIMLALSLLIISGFAHASKAPSNFDNQANWKRMKLTHIAYPTNENNAPAMRPNYVLDTDTYVENIQTRNPEVAARLRARLDYPFRYANTNIFLQDVVARNPQVADKIKARIEEQKPTLNGLQKKYSRVPNSVLSVMFKTMQLQRVR